MELDRDPTDLGLARVLSAEERAEIRAAAEAARRERRRREIEEPSGPPASQRVVERVRASHGFPRSRASRRLGARCPLCQAEPNRWCRRGRRGEVPGLTHEGRPETDGD